MECPGEANTTSRYAVIAVAVAGLI